MMASAVAALKIDTSAKEWRIKNERTGSGCASAIFAVSVFVFGGAMVELALTSVVLTWSVTESFFPGCRSFFGAALSLAVWGATFGGGNAFGGMGKGVG